LPDTFTAVGEFTAVTLTFDPHLNFTTARAHTHLTSLSRQIRQPAHRGVGDLILALVLSADRDLPLPQPQMPPERFYSSHFYLRVGRKSFLIAFNLLPRCRPRLRV
jgi:hypothetical protein